MDLAIRKLGNSAGVILPATLLKSLGLSVGQHLEAEEVDGKLMLTPRAKKYTLNELLAQCDQKAPPPATASTALARASLRNETIGYPRLCYWLR